MAKRISRTKWGPWTLEGAKLHRRAPFHHYWVDLQDASTSSSACLDWIMQVSSKAWITRSDVGWLIKALDDLVDPQATLCSNGIEAGRKVMP